MRTSQSHPLLLDSVPIPGGGILGMTIAPGKKGQSVMGDDWDRDLVADCAACSYRGSAIRECRTSAGAGTAVMAVIYRAGQSEWHNLRSNQ